MTAVAVNALDAARAAATGMRHRLVAGSNKGVDCSCGWFGPGAEYETHAATAIADALLPLLAEVRRGRALREAVEGLAEGAASAADLPVLKGDRFDAGVAVTYRSYADRLRELLAAVDGGEQS